MVSTERKDALSLSVTFNQIRNSINILIEMMEEIEMKAGAKEEDIIKRLRTMGKNVAKSFVKYWSPQKAGTDEMLFSIYSVILGSSVIIEEPADKRTTLKDFRGKKVYDVIDNKCPMCKRVKDTNISGCEIVLGLVEGIFEELHVLYPEKDVPLLKAEEVSETKTRGDKQCKHRYVLQRING